MFKGNVYRSLRLDVDALFVRYAEYIRHGFEVSALS